MTEIIAALITAVASIVVAIINNSGRKREREQAKAAGIDTMTATNPRWWYLLGSVTVIWLIISPIIIHHDFSTVNFFALIPFTLLLAAVFPVRALNAAAIVLGLHAVNFLGEPIQRLVSGGDLAAAFSGFDLAGILLFIGSALLNALIAGWLSRWQRSRQKTDIVREESIASMADNGTSPDTEKADPSGDISQQLARLHSLYKEGGLTEEEYQNAKQKILNSAGKS